MPAFSGLYAPYWKESARGVIAGLTRYANKGHLARAVLEATAYQTREVVEAMEKDAKTQLTSLRVDGGMVGNEMLMQLQSDILNREVVRPKVAETTALGAAYAADSLWDFSKKRTNCGPIGRRIEHGSLRSAQKNAKTLSPVEKSGHQILRLGGLTLKTVGRSLGRASRTKGYVKCIHHLSASSSGPWS